METEKLIGREQETAEIQKCIKSNKSEFVIIYGRRRVGKTFLVKKIFNGIFDFYFVGSSRMTSKMQLEDFASSLSKYSGIKTIVPQNWKDAFNLLSNYLETLNEKRKKIIFIDEMPWIDRKQSDFLAALEHFWNNWVTMRDDIVLIACGSATSWMINNLVKNRGGLHNRITRRIYLHPFSLHETELYLKYREFDWNRIQIMQCYMIVGGVPYYLSLLDNRLSIPQNIDNLFFRQGGLLQNEFENLYNALFSSADKYINIVKALSQKQKGLTRDEIIAATNYQGGSLTTILNNLENCDFIETYNQFGNEKKNTIYKIVDFYTLFYFKYIYGNHTKDAEYWTHIFNTQSVASWQGMAFELLCRCHLQQIKHALGISGIATKTSSWKYIPRQDSQDQGTQIDMVIERVDRMIHLCEMKFRERRFAINKAYADTLSHRMKIFKEKTETNYLVVNTIVTPEGLTDSKYNHLIHSTVTSNDLFAI